MSPSIMAASSKLKLLIWKNFLLQRRHKWQTLFEIASPVIFSLLLILIRCLMDPISHPDIFYPHFSPTYINMTTLNLGKDMSEKSGTLAFSPENALTRKITKNAMSKIGSDNFGFWFLFGEVPDPKGFKNADEMEKALTQPNAMDDILVGIQFDDSMANATEWPDDIVVTLRFPAIMRTTLAEHPMVANWRTNLLFPLFPQTGPREPGDKFGGKTPGYSSEMFLAIQHSVSQGIIMQKYGKSIHTTVHMQRLPQPPTREDPLLIALERFISVVIMIGFAYTFVNTVRVVTEEMELQLKETMAIMGLPSWLHWLAWFIKQFSFLLVSAILMVILFKVPISKTSSGEWFSVLTFTPWTILFFFMILFVVSSLAFSFMVSVFFSKSNSAASFMGLIWFASYALFCFTQMIYGQISLTTKLALSLVSNTAVGFVFQMLVWCEGNGRGLQWDEFFTPISYHDQFQPGHVVLMLLLDTILYFLIAIYVEKIRPGTYGVPLPWYYPFTKSFWISKASYIAEINEKASADLEYKDALLNVIHDVEPKDAPIGVNIKNLSKIYTRRKRVVNNLNLRIYENEITVLLGHNGAGKTTTISMLTGMVPPTTGTATINGYNIVTETEMARHSLGICPQHNVLFPDLTVAEHIIFYSRLKGLSKTKIDQEVNHFVKLLELEEKRDVASANLSGGQKRRLSVAAAMCGSSRVVLLDEPTSGLDPAARRALWDLLQKEKKGRTIILTTHFMDEADVLGDRIAIMSDGRLRCYGSPYFLKKHYGVGYKLTILKADKCDVDQVTRFFREFVPNVKENTNVGSELTYILPSDNINKFPEMLRKFEEIRESMHVASYGLSVTSLEEVFMNAGTEDSSEVTMKVSKCNGNYINDDIELTVQGNQPNNPMEKQGIKKVVGLRLLINHVKAMFMKQAFNTWRSKMPSSIQLIWPVINIIISVVLSRSWEFLSELPPLTLNFESGFKRTQTILAQAVNLSDGSIEAKAMNAYKDYFKTSEFPGMTLTDIGTMDMAKFYMKLSTTDIPRIRYETLAGATFTQDNITAWFSNYGYHDSAMSLALVNNAILRAVAPGTSLKFVNHPLPYTLENWISVMATGSSMAFQFSFNLGFCLGFVSSFLVLFVIKERTSGAKLLQKISGLRPAVLWITAWFWDWMWMLLISLLIVITMACFQETTLSTPEELGRALLVLSVYSMAIVPLHYLASFYFDEAATGFTKMCFVNVFLGCMPFLITEVLRFPQIGSPYYAQLFDYIFSFLPIYNVCRSLRDMSVTSFSILACNGICEQLKIANCTRQTVCKDLDISLCCIDDDPFLQWKEPGIGRYLFMTFAVGAAAFIAILIKEYELQNKIFYTSTLRTIPPVTEDEDSDVSAERARVENMNRPELTQSSLVCKDLSKFYGSLLAVNRLSFGVERGECFGLLGINGAGKTTTFRMLTGDERIGSGDAFVRGLSLKTNVEDVHKHIGYCPQFDALFDNLTARETLHIFCLLRGIPAEIGTASALYLANSLGFAQHFDKKVYECSGGTKRKISAAVALLGDSSLVYLDEPTTGMDPASKRLVWSSISQAARGGRSVVLTSHSMEECEALCSRLTVMVSGRLHCLGPLQHLKTKFSQVSGRSVVLTSHSMEECEALCSRLTVMVSGRLHCLGPLQHLKTKFSQGYSLVVKCAYGPDPEADLARIDEYIKENFSDAKLIESYLGISTYYLQDTSTPWWRVFAALEAARRRFPIEDYSVSQTTLEQVFLRFTRMYTKQD